MSPSPSRRVAWAGCAAIVLAALAGPAAPAVAADTSTDLDLSAFCPATGDVTRDVLDEVTLADSPDKALSQGVTIEGSTTSTDGTYEYTNLEKYSPTTRHWSMLDHIHDPWVKGWYAPAAYEFPAEDAGADARGTVYERYSTQAANEVMGRAVSRLGRSTVWTAKALSADTTTIASRQLRWNLLEAGSFTTTVSNGDGTVSCDVDGDSVHYTVSYTSLDVADVTVTLDADLAPVQVEETYSDHSDQKTYESHWTFTYGEPTGAVVFPAATDVVTPAVWRQAYTKAALQRMRYYATSWAKYDATKKKTVKTKVKAIRTAARRELDDVEGYYFWSSSWTPEVHVQDVRNGARIWITDPRTHRRDWVQLTLTAKQKIKVTTNIS